TLWLDIRRVEEWMLLTGRFGCPETHPDTACQTVCMCVSVCVFGGWGGVGRCFCVSLCRSVCHIQNAHKSDSSWLVCAYVDEFVDVCVHAYLCVHVRVCVLACLLGATHASEGCYEENMEG